MSVISNRNKQAYFVGGGLASIAGAVYLVEDAGFRGENIHILESLPIPGGSNDGAGDKEEGFVCRGGRMLNEETYENFWELMSRIPSLELPEISVREEILAFDHAHPTHARARLIDKDGRIKDVHSMGFNHEDRMKMLKLFFTGEKDLDHLTIRDWFDDHFFGTAFWYMWQTTFAWQEWSGLYEFRRYMNRMILEFSRIDTLEGVTRTPYNQYESVILPLKRRLDTYGVDFSLSRTVTDLDFRDGDGITVTAIQYTGADGKEGKAILREDDLCFFTNGCITDNSANGDYRKPAEYRPGHPPSFDLWGRIAAKKSGLGNPAPFSGKPDETKWCSFTATFNGDRMLQLIESLSGNTPGSGGLMTFTDSSWRMSIVVAVQPHFKAQGDDTTIFWGYGLYPDKTGDFVKKPMIDCSGEEILTELIHHLHVEKYEAAIKEEVVNVIPVMMPYIDALFQPHARADRPPVVPAGSTNLAMIGQFVEIPRDMVFTEEYSVRSARQAVYTLLHIDRRVEPVTPYNKRPHVLAKAVHTAYR